MIILSLSISLKRVSSLDCLIRTKTVCLDSTHGSLHTVSARFIAAKQISNYNLANTFYAARSSPHDWSSMDGFGCQLYHLLSVPPGAYHLAQSLVLNARRQVIIYTREKTRMFCGHQGGKYVEVSKPKAGPMINSSCIMVSGTGNKSNAYLLNEKLLTHLTCPCQIRSHSFIFISPDCHPIPVTLTHFKSQLCCTLPPQGLSLCFPFSLEYSPSLSTFSSRLSSDLHRSSCHLPRKLF
jgi:hypothetical protein